MRIHFALLLFASWYGPTGYPTAYGKEYDPQALVCAADDWPEGTILSISGPIKEGTKPTEIRVRVIDRLGPASKENNRQLDLSPAAFRALAPLETGVILVRVEVEKEAGK